ncbi:MAG: hypothetical protein ABI383_00095 [Acidobacteriaceae bacterium]
MPKKKAKTSPEDISPEPQESQPPLLRASRLIALAAIRDIRLKEISAKFDNELLGDGEPMQVEVVHRGTGQKTSDELDVQIAFTLKAIPASKKPALVIKAVFNLRYSLPDEVEIDQDEIDAFASTNSMLNSWPYWREIVQNTVARMGLPPLVLPLYRINQMPAREEGRQPTESGQGGVSRA